MHIITIDAGGTKTKCTTFDLSGNTLFESTGGIGSVVVSLEEAKSNIVKEIIVHINRLKISNALCVLGIAGIDSIKQEDKLVFSKELESINALNQVIIKNDAEVALYDVTGGYGAGVLVLAGTGSIVLGIENDNTYSVGGWGHLIDDEGSAYAIAINLIKKIAQSFDGNKELTQLEKAYMEYLKITNQKELKTFVYQNPKSEVASTAKWIADNANNYSQARELLIEAGRNLAKQVIILAKRMNSSNLKIGFNGSVIQNNEVVFNTFITELNKIDISFDIVSKKLNANRGCYFLAMRRIKYGIRKDIN